MNKIYQAHVKRWPWSKPKIVEVEATNFVTAMGTAVFLMRGLPVARIDHVHRVTSRKPSNSANQ